MSTLTYFLLVLVAAVLALLAYASTRPDEFRIERRLRITAPAKQHWLLVGELRSLHCWNPYERKDALTKSQ